MASNVGPLFAKSLKLADDIYDAALFDDNVYPLVDEAGDVCLYTVYAEDLIEDVVEHSQQIFIAEVVKEDGYDYYGFASLVERLMFAQFRKIDSIGPKLAALAVAKLSANDLQIMCQTGKAPSGIKVSGLGPKKMLKLSQGLKASAKKILPLLAKNSGPVSKGITGSATSIHQESGEEVPAVIVNSLERYGLKAVEVRNIFGQLLAEDPTVSTMETASILKLIFQRWGQRKARMIGKETR